MFESTEEPVHSSRRFHFLNKFPGRFGAEEDLPHHLVALQGQLAAQKHFIFRLRTFPHESGRTQSQMSPVHEGNCALLTNYHFEFTKFSRQQVKDDEMERYEEFWAANDYIAGGYDQRRDFELLDQEMSKRGATGNRLFYLAVPPSVFEVVTANIRNACMASK